MAQEETMGATLPDGRNRDELILAYAAGELTPEDETLVENLLASHPELQETIALYWSLRLALAMDPLAKPGSRATARTRAIFDSKGKRTRMQCRLHALARKVTLRAPLVGLAALAILLLLLPLGVTASSDTTPGDSLYPVKRSVESLKLALTFNPGKRAQLNIRLADVRVREINELIIRKQYHLLAEPLADYEMHVTNAVRGLGALPGDESAHRSTATRLEYGLEKIRRSLAPVPDASPPEVKANVTQLLNKADVAEAFLKADRELVRNETVPDMPTPPEPARDAPSAVIETLEPPAPTPVILRPTQPPMGVVVTGTRAPLTIPPTTASPTGSPLPTREPDTSTLTPPTATATAALPTPRATSAFNPTVVSTLEPTVASTATSTAEPTFAPTLVNTSVPSLTPTVASATGTPLAIPTPTVIPATETAAPSTPTEIPATGTPNPTDMPIVTDTPVPIETETTPVPKETPMVPGSPG